MLTCIDSSDSGLLGQESPLTRLQSNIASIQAEPRPRFQLGTMDANFLAPAAAASAVITKQKERTMQIAQEQQQALAARLKKNNIEMPPFEFLELIGKGAFGRVFKANDLKRNKVVALKVVDVDPHDFKVHYLEKDESIQTVLHEIKILTQLRDSNATNINLIIDAFPIHSQLWIVTEYCPGGSLHTLMQGVDSKLEEKYIIPVARELAIALRAIHAAGIIHRDVKAANVMIHENGSLQLIDFGVAGLLQTSKDKRSTIIGTPHWMPPEMSSQLVNQGPSTVDYATEIDVWAYGCTLYEIATGNPPYHKAEPGRKLTMMLKRSAPTLKQKDFSNGLVDLVEFIMKTSPQDRPSMEAILQHPYLLDTEENYPTHSLADLVKMYYRWEYSGGQRLSLFMPGGAEAAAFPTIGDDDGEWNFSTTMNFDAQHMAEAASNPRPVPPPSSAMHKAKSSLNMSFSMSNAPSIDDDDIEVTITEPHDRRAPASGPEGKIERGEKSLRAIFDLSAPEVTKPSLDRSVSDLPLRNASSGLAVHKEVDKSATVKTPSIDLSSVNTIKANRMNRSGLSLDKLGAIDREDTPKPLESSKRATMEWSFASAQETPAEEVAIPARQAHRGTLDWSFATAGTVQEEDQEEVTFPARPPLRHMVTQPIAKMDPRPESVLDLDELWESDLSSAMNTAPASDDEGFANYDLSDAQQPFPSAPPATEKLTADPADEMTLTQRVQPHPLSANPHPLSALRAPIKLKCKIAKALMYHYDFPPELADRVVTGDPAPPHDLTHGNEDFALECIEEYIAENHANLPFHLKRARRNDMMDGRIDVFTKYLASGNYPFEKYVTDFDFERWGEPYSSSGEDTSEEYEEETEREEEEDEDDPMPTLRGVDHTALLPGASDQALENEFRVQMDQFANTVLPWAQRKLKAMALDNDLALEDDEDEGTEGGDEA
ncbi:MAG: hypothetical protein Q9208_005968 [Pyrenodesmia sp. 3 TL-2023]